MAENEERAESTAISTNDEQKRQGPLFSISPNFRPISPPLKRENKEVIQGTNTAEEESETQKPEIVRFPATRHDFPVLKLEVEEPEQGINPRNMWPVYALGGFMILRWVWARWKERMANKPSPGDEEPSPKDYD